MRLSFKVIAYMWLGLLLIISGLLYHAYTNLRPEMFVALMSEQVQKNFPGANLEFGKIDYRFSLDFNLNLKNISLRRNGKLLASLGEVELKVPWWLVIINQGNAQINLTKFDIYVDHHPAHSLKNAPSKDKINTIKVPLPSYLSETKFTLRAKDISVKDIHDDRSYLKVSKLLVREFQYGKNSAYELNIPIAITHQNVSINSELWLFGDVTPRPEVWDLKYRGELRVKDNGEKFQLDDLVIAGATTFKPGQLDISSNVEILFEKKSVGTGKFQVNQDLLNVDLKLANFPLTYFSFFYDDIKNPFMEKMTANGDGHFKMEKNINSGLAKINGKLSYEGNFIVSDNFKFPGTWQLSFQNNRYEVSFITPKAELSFFRRSVVDTNTGQVSQFNQELGFTGLDLGQTLVSVKALPEFITEVFPAYFHTSISFKDCNLDNRLLNGNFRYGYTPDQKFYQMKMNEGETSLEVNYHDKGLRKLSLLAKHFIWNKSFQFLGPWFEAKSAEVHGEINGQWNQEWFEGEWLSEITIEQASDFKGQLGEVLDKGLNYFTLDRKNIDELSLNFSVKNKILKLKSLELNQPEKMIIAGTLNNETDKSSVLNLSYPKSKKLKAINKEIKEKFWQKENP